MYTKKKLKEGIVDPVAEHYEEKFEFPLWTLIKQRAEEKDISYSDAALEVEPEYARTLRIRDDEYNHEMIMASDRQGVPAQQAVNIEGYKLKID